MVGEASVASTQPIPVVMATSSQQGRIARIQATTRQINEEIEQTHPAAEGYTRILCECGQLECDRLITITVAEYEALRADATRFAVVRAHVIPEVERVVEETDRYTVVVKREGPPAAVAVEQDPRG
jgi:hypothetical protein